jgi:hypothetical protein
VTEAAAGCLRDRRQAGKVEHEVLELVRQRVFGLARGYAHGNDAARLADDALHKWLLDRDPLSGTALASQPTLSRFENAISPLALTRLGHALADVVIGPTGPPWGGGESFTHVITRRFRLTPKPPGRLVMA